MQEDLECLFWSAFSVSNDAAFATDNTGTIVAFNRALERMFSLSVPSECGESMPGAAAQFVGQLNIAAGPDACSHSAARGTARRRYRRFDGTIFWGEQTNLPIHNTSGKHLGIVSIIHDVSTDARLVEGLTSLVAAPVVGAPNSEQAIRQLLHIGCQYFGMRHGHLGRLEGDDYVVDTAFGSWPCHGAGDRLPTRHTLNTLAHDEDDLLILEPSALLGLAGHGYVRQTGVAIFLAGKVRVHGRVYGSLCFADQNPGQQALTARDRLFLRLMTQWAGLVLNGRIARQALDVATRDLDRLAHIASHDLQEPLRRVVTYCQILMEDFGAEISDEAVDVIETIQTGGKRMRLMLNDLLVYSRLNRQLKEPFEPVDMASILCHAIEDLTDKIEQSQAQIETMHLPLVWGRAPLLQMVCYHLLSNAIKFAGDHTPAIDISIQTLGRFWQFQVADRGIGIEPRFADCIFDIFKRLHPRDDFSGTGVGLAICKQIIERHGGAINLDTDYRNGTRILFTLPKDRWLAMP